MMPGIAGNLRRAGRYRILAFAMMFISGALFMVGVIPGMFAGNLVLTFAAVGGSVFFFTLGFLFAMIGWAEIEETQTSYYPREHAAEHRHEAIPDQRTVANVHDEHRP